VKSQLAAGVVLPSAGNVFISVREGDKAQAIECAQVLAGLGFKVIATKGTAAAIEAAGVAVTAVNKVTEGRPHIVDMIVNGDIGMIFNTVDERRQAIQDSYSIRHEALKAKLPVFTTIAGAKAACIGLRDMKELNVYDLQGLHRQLNN
jgi:carbamoyl-phosphate synthase large subunit